MTFPGNTDSFYDKYICFLGAEEEPAYDMQMDYATHYYLEKAVRVKTLQATERVSLHKALVQVGVTAEEWLQMRTYFFEYN